MKSRFAMVLGGAAGAAAFLAPSMALAQQQSENEIVVTATRRETALNRTAVSADVVAGEQLEARQIRDPEDLAHSTAGLLIEQGSSAPKIAIRGVSFDNFDIQAENGVTTYIDGIVILRTQAQLGAFNDLDRVEVLKGPQGSAFGRNSTGGTINYITRQPEQGFHASVNAGVGSFDRIAYGGVLNYADEQWGVRVSGQAEQDDGYITNLVTGSDDLNGRDNKTGRIAFAFTPNNAFQAHYFYSRSESNSGGPATSYATALDAGTAAFLATLNGLTIANPAAPLTLAFNGEYEVVNRFDPFTRNEADLHGLTLKYDFGPATLTSITGYLKFDQQWRSDVAASSNTLEGLVSVPKFDESSEQFSQELLLSGENERLNWVLGAYYLWEDVSQDTFFDFNFPGCDPLNGLLDLDRCTVDIDNGQKTTSYAFFADGQLKLTDRLRLNAGVRWTHDEKETYGGGQQFTAVSSGVPFPAPSIDGITNDDSAVSGRLGLEFDLGENLFGYFTYSRGYKAGGINKSDGGLYDPEYIDNYEVGLKGGLFSNAVTFATAAYYMNYTDIQVFVSPSTPIPTVLNAASAEIYGVDLNVNWRATDALSFDLALNWLPTAEYSDFVAFDPIVMAVVDYSGGRLPRAPEVSGVVGVNLDVPVGEDWRLRARLENYHVDRIAFNQGAILRPAQNSQDGYDLVNANVTLSYNDRVDLRIFGRNLNDAFYVTTMVETVGMHYGEFGRPTEIGAEIRYHF